MQITNAFCSATDTLEGRLGLFLTGRRPEPSLVEAPPKDEADALRALLRLQHLRTGPVDGQFDALRFERHECLTRLRAELEDRLLDDVMRTDAETSWGLPLEPVAAMRALARLDAVPPIYDWLATEATVEELAGFVGIEGGPDGGFDDLVSLCQVGLHGRAKLELASNYWDEMGRGELSRIHTILYERCVGALGVEAPDPADVPTEALARSALNGVLAANRRLQPELVGALGMVELQAGPRCRRVLEAMRRLGLGPDAHDFYAEHAEADPRHGKAWLDNAVETLASKGPVWAEGMIRGARWRAVVNRALFAALEDSFGLDRRVVA